MEDRDKEMGPEPGIEPTNLSVPFLAFSSLGHEAAFSNQASLCIRHVDRHIIRHTDSGLVYRQTDRQTDRQAGSQTCRHAGRKKTRETDSQTRR